MKGSYSHHREIIEQHKAITYRKIKSDFTSSSTFYHLGIPGFPFAYFEVDLFLVVNGYLMAMLYGEIKSEAEVIDFFVRKGARLLPAYFTVLALTAIVGVLLLLPREIEHLMTQGIWSAVVLPNFGFWQSAVYFDSIMLRPLLDL